MKTVTLTEFRKNASGFFSDVEHGEILVVIRRGKPIAEILPVLSPSNLPAWKQSALRLIASNASLATVILGERNENIF